MKIIFEFAGGPRDGKTVVGDTEHGRGYAKDEGDAFFAKCFYDMSHGGQIGAAFHGFSDHALDVAQKIGFDEAAKQGFKFNKHKYQVIERLEENGECLIRAKYVQAQSS